VDELLAGLGIWAEDFTLLREMDANLAVLDIKCGVVF
jgi:hypothetical protein